MKTFLTLAALGLASSLALAAGPIQGPVQSPIQSPIQGPIYKTVVETVPVCCDRCIDYKHHRPRTEPCGPRTEVTMLVKDNCECCYVQVPMCLPSCCLVDEPQICHKGLHVVDYTWSSGYKVRVVLTKRGKVFVHYNV